MEAFGPRQVGVRSVSWILGVGQNQPPWSLIQSAGILVNAVCPGWVAADMGGAGADRSVAEGAASVLWAATLPNDEADWVEIADNNSEELHPAWGWCAH